MSFPYSNKRKRSFYHVSIYFIGGFILSEEDGEKNSTTLARAQTAFASRNQERVNASLLDLFRAFFRIGAFTFGGGWAMVPLIREELVRRRGWMQEREFVDLLAIAQSAPGPVAINTSVITGFKIRGFAGAAASALGSALPSFCSILLIAMFFVGARGASGVEAVFSGMRPAIFGLLASAVWQVGKSSVKTRTDVAFMIGGAALLFFFRLSPVFVILLAGFAGILWDAAKRRIPGQSTEDRVKQTRVGGDVR